MWLLTNKNNIIDDGAFESSFDWNIAPGRYPSSQGTIDFYDGLNMYGHLA